MITDDREIVTAIRARLADRIGSDRYEVWFGPPTQLAVRGDTLVIGAASPFFQDWLRSHFRKDLESCALEVCGRNIAVEFRVVVTAETASEGKSKVEPKTRLSAIGTQNVARSADCHQPNRDVNLAANGHTTGPSRRLHSLETFVVGNSNCLAHKAAQMSVTQPGNYSPLFVHGPTGCGKTHLLEGVYASFRKRYARAKAVYLSAEQFTSHFLQALHKSGMASFRSRYRDLELLLIDDLQFLAGKKATIGELQHTIDALLRGGKQLVFAADRPPAMLKCLGAELTSRLSGGMVCRLEPAEYATRVGIVRNQAALLGMNVPEDVQVFIATHLSSQARELIGALKRLHAMSMAHNRPISIPLAEETLAELIDHQGQIVKLPDIEKAVCEVFGLEPNSLQSGRKAKQVSHPRMLAMYLARKYTRAPLSEIGGYFGKRSHSTVISAQKKIEGWITGRGPQKLATTGTSPDEMIRRVEAQLRVS